MDGSCDRCIQHALTKWWNPVTKAPLWLCGHHTLAHRRALLERGWVSLDMPDLPELARHPGLRPGV